MKGRMVGIMAPSPWPDHKTALGDGFMWIPATVVDEHHRRDQQQPLVEPWYPARLCGLLLLLLVLPRVLYCLFSPCFLFSSSCCFNRTHGMRLSSAKTVPTEVWNKLERDGNKAETVIHYPGARVITFTWIPVTWIKNSTRSNRKKATVSLWISLE